MNDEQFTPALWLFGMGLGLGLAYLELSWLKRSFQLAGLAAMIPVALVNILFVWTLLASFNSYLALFILPIPLIPALYLLSKALAYYVTQRMTGNALHSPIKIAVISLFFHSFVILIAGSMFERINPTRAHLEQAIRDKHNALLDFMLWISVRSEPNMTILVNEAITDGNDDAVRRLIRRGADPTQRYRIREAGYDTQWRLTKWLLSEGVKPEQSYDISPAAFANIAVSYGVPELDYCIQKGFAPEKYPQAIHAAMRNQHLRTAGVIQPDEVEAVKAKILVLLKHGADINGEDEYGLRPVFALLNLGVDLSPVLTTLIEKGADINSPNAKPILLEGYKSFEGLTPLMLAVINKEPKYVSILIRGGAGKAARDAQGLTALDHARKRNDDPAMVRLLQ